MNKWCSLQGFLQKRKKWEEKFKNTTKKIVIIWVFWIHITDIWQTFWVIWERGSNLSNLRLNMNISKLKRLKNNKIPHIHPNFTMCVSLNRLQFKNYASITRNRSRCDSDIAQTNSSWIRLCINYMQPFTLWLRY